MNDSPKSYLEDFERKKAMIEIYRVKLYAFRFSKTRILKEYPQYNDNILAFFHDAQKGRRTDLRNKLNLYMKTYVQEVEERGYEGLTKKYAKFYKVTFEDIKKEFEKSNYVEREKYIEKCKNMMKIEQYEYKRIMQIGDYAFYDHSGENIVKQPVKETTKETTSNIEKQPEIKSKISKPKKIKKVKFRPIVKKIKEYKVPTVREIRNNKNINVSGKNEIITRQIPNIGLDIEI